MLKRPSFQRSGYRNNANEHVSQDCEWRSSRCLRPIGSPAVYDNTTEGIGKVAISVLWDTRGKGVRRDPKPGI